MRMRAIDFAEWVEKEIQSLSAEDFHLRTRKSKRLREELYPISRLALLLKQPGLEVLVEAHGPDGRVDARIYETGFRNRSFSVEATYAYDHEQSLRDELMVIDGVAPGSGPIARINRRIEASPSAVDEDYHVLRIARMVAKCFREKTSKSYPSNTILIIAFEEITMRGWFAWVRFLGVLFELINAAESSFLSVYLINVCSNEIQQISSSSYQNVDA